MQLLGLSFDIGPLSFYQATNIIEGPNLLAGIHTSTFHGVPMKNPKGWWIDIRSTEPFVWHPNWKVQKNSLFFLVFSVFFEKGTLIRFFFHWLLYRRPTASPVNCFMAVLSTGYSQMRIHGAFLGVDGRLELKGLVDGWTNCNVSTDAWFFHEQCMNSSIHFKWRWETALLCWLTLHEKRWVHLIGKMDEQKRGEKIRSTFIEASNRKLSRRGVLKYSTRHFFGSRREQPNVGSNNAIDGMVLFMVQRFSKPKKIPPKMCKILISLVFPCERVRVNYQWTVFFFCFWLFFLSISYFHEKKSTRTSTSKSQSQQTNPKGHPTKLWHKNIQVGRSGRWWFQLFAHFSSFFSITHSSCRGFPKMVVPAFHTPKWSFLEETPMGLLGKPTILGNTHVGKTDHLGEKQLIFQVFQWLEVFSYQPNLPPDGLGVVRRWQSWMFVAVWGCPQRAKVWDVGCDGCDEYNTPRKTNMTMENQAFEDVSPMKNGDFPLPC